VTAETDSKGIASFAGVPVGEYTLTVDSGVLAPSADVVVSAHPDASSEIELKWPERTVAARQLRGKLAVAGEGTSKSNRPPIAELLNLRSGEILANSVIDAEGYYQFEGIEPGLYAVRIVLDSKEERARFPNFDFAVELGFDSSDQEIPGLKLEDTGCHLDAVRLKDGTPFP
jgi:hypothetical protein